MSTSPEILLVPVDGSEGSIAAAKLAAQLAKGLGVPVRLLFAFAEDPMDMFGLPGRATSPEDVKYLSPSAFAELRDHSAEKVFKVAREALDSMGVDIEEKVLPGKPAQAIVKYAGGETSPMIVMGRRGGGRFQEMILGSVSQQVLHHVVCPVTVVS